MFDRELMILGLRRQQNLLQNLVEQLEVKTGWDTDDSLLYQRMTKEVSGNLKKLRRIKSNYLAYRN